MNRPPPRAWRSAIVAAAVVAAARPVAAAAATTATVTLNVSSTVAAPPGTCQFSLVDRPDANVLQLPTANFAVACSGPGPYFVAIDDASGILLPMPGDVVRGDPAGRAGAGHSFMLPGAAQAINAPDRTPLRPITAIVQY